MADRKKLQEELNRINQLYHETDLNMNKSGGSMQQRQQLRDMLNKKKESLTAELGDDLSTLNSGKGISIKDASITKGTKDTIGQGFDASKSNKILKMLGKKAAGVIPFAGAGMAALSGDPAMAADELAGDIPVAGQIYEAIKPTDSGNPEEEREMLAARAAQPSNNKQYDPSLDLEEGKPQRNIFSGLKNLLGKK